MKKFFILTYGILCLTFPSFGQANVTLSEDFENATNSQPNGVCLGFITSATLPSSGDKSHGTPRIMDSNNDFCGGNKGILIGVSGSATSGTCGEGFFLNYSFRDGVRYTISFKTKIASISNSLAVLSEYQLFVRTTTNNVNPGSGTNCLFGSTCEDEPPTMSGSNPIQFDELPGSPFNYSVLGTTSNCVLTSIDFCPTKDYGQIWFVPQQFITTQLRNVGLIIDDIVITENCTLPKVFNDPVADIPSGFIGINEAITTTNVGAGFVENKSTMNTEMKACNYIDFLPNTYLVTSGNSYFWAHTGQLLPNCPEPSGANNLYSNMDAETKNNDSENYKMKTTNEIKSDEILIYPNPNNGRFEIRLPDSIDFTKSYVKLAIYNSIGQILFAKQMNLNYEIVALADGITTFKNDFLLAFIDIDGKKFYCQKIFIHK